MYVSYRLPVVPTENSRKPQPQGTAAGMCGLPARGTYVLSDGVLRTTGARKDRLLYLEDNRRKSDVVVLKFV